MVEFDAKVLDVIRRTADVKSFRFEAPPTAQFIAGQFFLLTIKIDGREASKHFSFSSSPTEKGYIEFTKRITASPFSGALARLKAGDRARIKMPMGTFTFQGEHSKVAFLSGGVGITPIRSMCKYAMDTGLNADIALLYGNNKEEDIIFRSDFDRMASANSFMRVVYTLTSPDVAKKAWSGRTGYIDDQMIREEVPDFGERVFYVCGPTRMVELLTETLADKLVVKRTSIRTEHFIGY